MVLSCGRCCHKQPRRIFYALNLTSPFLFNRDAEQFTFDLIPLVSTASCLLVTGRFHASAPAPSANCRPGLSCLPFSCLSYSIKQVLSLVCISPQLKIPHSAISRFLQSFNGIDPKRWTNSQNDKCKSPRDQLFDQRNGLDRDNG